MAPTPSLCHFPESIHELVADTLSLTLSLATRFVVLTSDFNFSEIRFPHLPSGMRDTGQDSWGHMGGAAIDHEVPCRCYKEDNQGRQQVGQWTFRMLITGL